MDFSLSEEHQMIRDMARDFAQNEIVPIAAHHDETGEFPIETIKKMGAQGLMGTVFSRPSGSVTISSKYQPMSLIDGNRVMPSIRAGEPGAATTDCQASPAFKRVIRLSCRFFGSASRFMRG